MSEDATTRPEPAAANTRSGSGSSGFLAVLLGGFIAGGAGYLAAYYTEFGLFQVDDSQVEVERLSSALDGQAQRLATLEENAARPVSDDVPEAVRSEIGTIGEQITAVSQRLDELQADPGTDAATQEAADTLSALQDRLAALESASGESGETETDASQSQQLSDLTQRLDELSGTVEAQAQKIDSQAQTIDEQMQTLESQAQAIAQAEAAARTETSRIAAQGAVSEIRAAVESGQPFADALGEIEGASDVTIPDALSGPAGAGVASLASLQESFPGAAREALSASIAETAGDGVVDRLGAFVRSQTGARSLGEKEGEGADAVLSRAEARLGDGDLDAALSELDALPEQGREAMSDWIARAEERLAARQALSDLSQSVNSI